MCRIIKERGNDQQYLIGEWLDIRVISIVWRLLLEVDEPTFVMTSFGDVISTIEADQRNHWESHGVHDDEHEGDVR